MKPSRNFPPRRRWPASLALALALLAQATAAQEPTTSTISGLVADYEGTAVAGATVDLVRTAVKLRSAATDADGRYRFEGLEPGRYTVRVEAAGFQPSERQLRVAAAAEASADFQLAPQTLEESILVTADTVRAEIAKEVGLTPGGVTVVDSEELFTRPVKGLADALLYVPGVWAPSNAGSDEVFVSIRGSNLDSTAYDKNGVKLLQDGLPVTTADGNNHNRIIDPLSANQTIVARGANALTYGASTLGGAIDFVSPTARNTAPYSAYVNTGSFGLFSGRATAGGAGETVDGLLTVESKDWDGYRDHSSQDRWGVYGNAGFKLSDSARMRVFATYVDNDELLPGALTREEVEEDPDQASAAALGGNYSKQLETARIAATTTWVLGANRSLTAGLSYEEQSLFHPIVDRILVDFDGPGPAPPVEVFSLLVDTDHRDIGAVARYEHSVGEHDLLVGLNYGDGTVEGGNFRNLDGKPNGISELVDNSADTIEAFIVDRWRASDRVTLVFGGQYVDAWREVRTTNADTGALSNPKGSFTSFNPRFGIIASLNDETELYGNVSHLFEAPTTFEMEDDVRGGNALLDPMEGDVVEVGVRSKPTWTGDTLWRWDVAAYYASIDDEILSVDDPDAPGNSLTTNIDKTIHAGLEALVSASFPIGDAQRLDPLLSLTFNRFNFDSDPVYGDNDLPIAPSYAARGEVIYRHDNGVWAGPTFELVGKRYADFANTYEVDSYGLMGLRGGMTVGRWDLFAEVQNLFDEEYIATVTALNEAGPDARVLHPGPSLSGYVGARFAF